MGGTPQNAALYRIALPTPYAVGDANVYLLEEGGRLILVDAGADTDECWEAFVRALAGFGFAPSDISQVWLTHTHPDHVGLIGRLTAVRDVPVFVHPKGIPYFTWDEAFHRMRIRFFERLYREMGCGEAGDRQIGRMEETLRRHLKKSPMAKDRVRPFPDGRLSPGVELLETPGHAPDHVAFLLAESRKLIAGDLLLSRVSSNAFVEPDADGHRILSLVEYVRSLEACAALDVARVEPGHGDPVDRPRELALYRLRRIGEKAEAVRSLVAQGMATANEIALRLYPAQYETQFFAVMSEVVGLLDYLEFHRMVEKELRQGVWVYSCNF